MIRGNARAEIQQKRIVRNGIGEMVEEWVAVRILTGYLDLSAGESRYETYNAKIQESDHIFISSYVPLGPDIRPETARMAIEGAMYDITLIDNPMGLNRQLEFYLKKVG